MPAPPGASPLEYDDDDGATLLDDGLSTCDEERPPNIARLTSAQAAALRADAANYRCLTRFLFFLTLLASLIVALVRSYVRPQETRGGAAGWDFDLGGDAWREEQDRRLEQTLAYLTTYAASDPSTLEPQLGPRVGAASRNAPQYQAALWIAQYDRARVPIPPAGAAARDRGMERRFAQRYSLATFFFATGGLDHWTWKMNFLSGQHECAWNDKFRVGALGGAEVFFGVLCDGAPDYAEGEEDVWGGTRTVTAISLPPGNRLFGTLPPEIRHLTHLKGLHLEGSKGLTGPIPFQYGGLKHLRIVALMDNSLSGKIPREFGQLEKMAYLRLERNQLDADTLQGDLDFMRDMESLNFVTLDYNPDITGTLPDMFSKLYNLEVLSLSNLGMYGTLPPSLSKLTKLKALYLDDNEFEGKVHMLQNLATLTHVYLENNGFDDFITDAFLRNSDQLKHLDISNCSFSGFVPGHFFQLPSLKVLDMSRNNLGGELPAEAMSSVVSTDLEFLSLHTNNLNGTIPTSIGKLKSLSTLDLSSNQISGDLPAEIGDLDDLTILFLGKNNFDAAPTPLWLRSMTQLTELSLKKSSLNATIPEWLGELTRLQFLDLGGNDLRGRIPQTLAGLTQLMVLILNGNRLEGDLGLGQLERLETLLIDDNELTGDTDAICAQTLVHFIADCPHSTLDASFNCTCCTLCCPRENSTCNDDEWLGNHEAMWEYGYNRLYWNFEDNGIISPYVDYNAHQG